MTDTLTSADDFAPMFHELWLALGPKERTDFDEKLAVYHHALRDIRAVSLRAAIERCIKAARIRALPAPGEIRARALEHHQELQSALKHRAPDLPPVPHTHCECRCGGRRWYRVMRDRATNAVREYPADIAAQTMAPDLALHAATFRKALEALAGEPMLRTHVHCKRHPFTQVDREPSQAHYLGLSADGCPVYDPDRRSASHEAAA
ncbi:MAG: hypothetical protein C0503_00795 [Gemmatimonas sp.]|nr:hypothetical protein [Gemmatimonas sp.]